MPDQEQKQELKLYYGSDFSKMFRLRLQPNVSAPAPAKCFGSGSTTLLESQPKVGICARVSPGRAIVTEPAPTESESVHSLKLIFLTLNMYLQIALY